MMEDLERRVSKCEEDIKEIQNKQTKSEVEQAKINTKLDNLLVTLGEVKNVVESIKARPSVWWDKFIGAVIGAIGAGIVAVLLNLLKG